MIDAFYGLTIIPLVNWGLLLETSSHNNLHQIISEPTHFTETCRSILDLIITDTPGIF